MESNILLNLRARIDLIDKEIVSSIAKRMEISIQIGDLKKKNSIAVFDSSRETAIHLLHKKYSLEAGISPSLIEKIFKLIIKHSRMVQTNSFKD